MLLKSQWPLWWLVILTLLGCSRDPKDIVGCKQCTPDATILGSVQDSAGRPVVGVAVTGIIRETCSTWRSFGDLMTQTDSAGNYRGSVRTLSGNFVATCFVMMVNAAGRPQFPQATDTFTGRLELRDRAPLDSIRLDLTVGVLQP